MNSDGVGTKDTDAGIGEETVKTLRPVAVLLSGRFAQHAQSEKPKVEVKLARIFHGFSVKYAG